MWGRLYAVHLLFTKKKQNLVLSGTPVIGMKLLRSINTAAQQVSWLKAKKNAVMKPRKHALFSARLILRQGDILTRFGKYGNNGISLIHCRICNYRRYKELLFGG